MRDIPYVRTQETARIGKYELEGEIGRGSQVRVFRAFDRDTARPVTLKVLTDVADKALSQRFRREVATAARLRHAGMIAIYELGEHVGLPFVAMQHLDGDDLGRALEIRRPLTLLQKMLIMFQVAEGVQAAHRGGLSYVGIRPSGIVLDADGNATVQDFGVVRLRAQDQDDRAYLAPEELTGHALPDSLCDIFVFGAVYYELLTGAHPFAEGEPLKQLVPECPQELERIVYRALQKRRELRYQSLDDVQYDAEPILRELKRTRAQALLANAPSLPEGQEVDESELNQAQGLIREVLELDPDNRNAQALRAELRRRLQRHTVRPRVEALLQQAEEEAGARFYSRAVESLRSAAQLDGDNPDVMDRLHQMGFRFEQSQKAAQLVVEARRLLEQQELTEAHHKISEALERDSAIPEAAELLQSINDAVKRREKEATLERELARAKSLLLLQSFEEAISVLVGLRQECPDSPAVEHWLAHVLAQKSKAGRQARDPQGRQSLASEEERFYKRGREKALELIEDQQYEQAADLLRNLLSLFPGDPILERDLQSALERAAEFEPAAPPAPVPIPAEPIQAQSRVRRAMFAFLRRSGPENTVT